MRCWTKSDFAITYHFGHISSISGPFLFEIGSKCAHFWGYHVDNWFKLVQLRCLKACNHNCRSSPVFGLFSVLWTGPLNTRFFWGYNLPTLTLTLWKPVTIPTLVIGRFFLCCLSCKSYIVQYIQLNTNYTMTVLSMVLLEIEAYLYHIVNLFWTYYWLGVENKL